MATIISGGKSALDLHLDGTIGTFRVSTEDGKSAGVEVRYLLTHVTLSQNSAQNQLLSMLAPVREVFDLKQLEFDEIMQRDIDDARVSLELIPYLLDTSTSGLIKLFPPIVAVALPLKPTSKVPDTYYRKVTRTVNDYPDHPGVSEHRITAGGLSEEQFEFSQLYRGDKPLSEGARLSLSKNNCTLAIVDGQHRAMALLALYRNLTGGWSDATRSPYEGYYKVWPDKEIRAYNLTELQLPVLICSFPQLDKDYDSDIDVIRAARRVFLTLNKTAKKVSDSRNKLLNDQDIVAECLRATLSQIKQLDVKDNTGLRIWNIELDQEGDRVKISSDVAFSGVSHLYHLTEHLLMSNSHARGIEAKGKVGAPRKRLDEAFLRLELKDQLTQEQRDVNTRVNYSDEIAAVIRDAWTEKYVPIIETILGKLHPFAAFSRATLNLNQELVGKRDAELLKMFFDGQATSRTFDDFRDGLNRRYSDKEPNWTTPEIQETLARVNGVLNNRSDYVEKMHSNRALFLLEGMSSAAMKKLAPEGVILKPIQDAIDRLYDDIFTTVAFQTAAVCTYAEAAKEAFESVDKAPPEVLDEFVDALNSFFRPKTMPQLKSMLSALIGELVDDAENIKLTLGGPTFRNIVLPGEMQPAEWPKYRYLLIELWKPSNEKLKAYIEEDRKKARVTVSKLLCSRRIAAYCNEQRISEADLSTEKVAEIRDRAKSNFEEFLHAVSGRKVTLDIATFDTQGGGVLANLELGLPDLE